jgi:hypothetical protein
MCQVSLSFTKYSFPLFTAPPNPPYWTCKGGKDFEGKESLKWGKGLAAERASSVEMLVRVYQPRNMEVLANHQVVKLDSIDP